MTAGSRSSPAITSAGSPGSNCWSEKMITDTNSSVGISSRRRRPRNVSTAAVPCPLRKPNARPSFQLQSDHPYQSIRHLRIAFEPGGMSNQRTAMVEVDDGAVAEKDVGDLLVDRLALGRIGYRPRFIEQLVH